MVIQVMGIKAMGSISPFSGNQTVNSMRAKARMPFMDESIRVRSKLPWRRGVMGVLVKVYVPTLKMSFPLRQFKKLIFN
ncbi:MAG: hypothetical protein JWM44_3234 [Bacilli bacterium]|nr:hypothetical protein [Bacilli bacterium]